MSGNDNPKRLQDLHVQDIMYFHKGGAHGNCEIDNPHFNPDLFREDCPLCIERRVRFNHKMGWED